MLRKSPSAIMNTPGLLGDKVSIINASDALIACVTDGEKFVTRLSSVCMVPNRYMSLESLDSAFQNKPVSALAVLKAANKHRLNSRELSDFMSLVGMYDL
jgi:hypothetical protein